MSCTLILVTRCDRRRRPALSQTAPESGARAPGLVLVNGAGCLPDGFLQVRNAGRSGRVGLLFYHAPHPKVAWIQVGRVGGPNVLGYIQGVPKVF